MSTSRAFTALLLAAGLSSAGCVRSFAHQPALSFQDLDYTSEGTKQPWPVNRIPLPRTANQYGMAVIPEMAYVDMPGSGPDAKTVVFIHGLGSYLKFWRAQLDAFQQQGYRVIAVDLPGFGKSDKPGGFPYTMEAMADAVLELVDTLGVEKPVLAGHSMGGQTSLSYAIRYPDSLSALVLASPAGFEKFTWREKEWFARVMSTEFIKAAPESAIWGSVRQGNFMHWRPELEWLIEERVRLTKSPEFDAYAYANVRTVRGLSNNDFVRGNLHRVTVPTVIIYGTDDRLIPNPFLHGGEARGIMEYGASHIPGAKLVAMEGCGHTVQLDCPERFNEAAFAFVREAVAGSIPVPAAPEKQEAPTPDSPSTPSSEPQSPGTLPPPTPGQEGEPTPGVLPVP
ncbi:Alpha/beta hydrolase fold protein [Myxococcus hansupus]|uniref:Alpha/beta hydrolase fold protein n=1 Tax=Pseudomyxococcus hansupus TaxID=1297742 RepID=A0A0H4X7C3_9BACT|nr:alpha/beta hydrolase [Myxococcus hansupus]AKQ69863.1 Alpha/beta hydrolase fold protein [Myxococcus hansupus]